MSIADARSSSARLLRDSLRVPVEQAVSAHYQADWRVRDFHAVVQVGAINKLGRLTATLER